MNSGFLQFMWDIYHPSIIPEKFQNFTDFISIFKPLVKLEAFEFKSVNYSDLTLTHRAVATEPTCRTGLHRTS